MSWASSIAGSVSTPNQSSRGGRRINGWIIHHNAARGGRGVLDMMRTGSKQVSANYQVLENGEVWGVVPRENRSWSASNSAWDGSSLTYEIANNSGGPGWTISEAAYHGVARTIAEDAAWAGIPINRTTVRGHGEGSAQGAGGSYSTACPGGIDLNRLVDLANQYASGGVVAGGNGVRIPIPQHAKDHDMLFLRVADDGNGKPFFTVLNTNTNIFYPPVYDIAPVAWTKTFGPFMDFTRADFLSLTETIRIVTGKPLFQGKAK